uniref:AMP-binding protein n=1 Tax=Nonomuraea rhizosphaerae TaxID=2665663 RepID=UPI001C601A93
MIEALQERAASEPGRVFCRFEGESLTYGDFVRRVGRCAAGLSAHGVRPGDRVAVMLRNHLDHVVTVYALAWGGAVHVPVSTHLKRAGLATQLADVRAAAIVAEAEFATEITAALQECGQAPRLFWHGLADSPDAHLGGGVPLAAALDSPAPPGPPVPHDLDREVMISYTSGTTGPPKGAVLNERFLQLGAASAAELAEVGRDDVLFLWEPFYHIAGWTTLYMAVNCGARVAMVERFSASRCWDQIRAAGATKLHYLGGVLNILLAQPPRADDRDNPVTIVWGAAAPRDRWREFEHRFGVQLREGYGLSEAANFALLNTDGPPGSIGRPIPQFDAWIADPSGRGPAAPDQVGEIILRPKQPGLTMVRFFGDEERTSQTLLHGIVRTGDLGYVDGDGYFYFAGRATDSLRRRGENVSAWEIERVANECPGVVDSAAIAVPSPVGEDDIKLVVHTSDPAAPAAADVYEWCKERLAYYQVPRYVEIVPGLPYGPTQRVQKKRLSRSVDGVFDA